MMDEDIKELLSARKWRKYIKWGADDFLGLAWHFTYIDQVLISFSSLSFPLASLLFLSQTLSDPL